MSVIGAIGIYDDAGRLPLLICRERMSGFGVMRLQLLIARLNTMFKQQQVETNTRDCASVWSLGSLFPKIAEKRQAVPIRDAIADAVHNHH